MIDKVGAEVVEDAAAAGGAFAPRAGLRLVAKTIESRLERHDAAKRIAVDELADRAEVAFPSPVLKHREHALLLRCERDELPRRIGRDRERLVDHDMFAGNQRAASEVEVGFVGSG